VGITAVTFIIRLDESWNFRLQIYLKVFDCVLLNGHKFLYYPDSRYWCEMEKRHFGCWLCFHCWIWMWNILRLAKRSLLCSLTTAVVLLLVHQFWTSVFQKHVPDKYVWIMTLF
jgi:hypothetical protein